MASSKMITLILIFCLLVATNATKKVTNVALEKSNNMNYSLTQCYYECLQIRVFTLTDCQKECRKACKKHNNNLV
uniref:Uncharacterized protein n=1 Tax=Solanum tuberosum TaxID=4113 RepID=M1AFR2_SOLTU